MNKDKCKGLIAKETNCLISIESYYPEYIVTVVRVK